MATATMGVSSVDRLARSKRPTVERTEIHIPPAPVFPLEAVTGDPRIRAQAVAAFNNALQKWRNDAWSIEAPFVPDAELQADVATLEDTTSKVVTKLDRAAVDIRRSEANITTISSNITSIDNSITTINNEITNINNAITGTGIVQANGVNPPTAILGSTGHFPYWRPSDPHLSVDSPIYVSAGFIGVGTVGPVTELDVVGVVNASTGFRVNNLAVAGTVLRSNGTEYIGGQVVLTTDVTGLLPTVSGGTNHGNYTAGSVIFAGAGGLLLTEDNANLFWDDVTNAFGVGLALPLSRLHVAIDDAVTTVTDVLRINHSLNTGGTAANFGTGILLTGETSTTDAQNMARIQTIWTTSTHATRTSALQFQTVNSAAVLATQLSVSGNGRIGFGSNITLSAAGIYAFLNLDAANVDGALTVTSNVDNSSLVAQYLGSLTYAGTGGFFNARSFSIAALNQSTNTGGSFYGGVFSARNNNAASRAASLLGLQGYVEVNSTGGTLVTAAALEASINNQGAGGTITNVYGLNVLNLANSAGTITNTYGVYVGDITAGTQSNVPYSFISTDANARQSFAGNTGMGGGLSVGDGGTTMTLGVVNATVGYRIAGAAALGTYLRGDGTNYVSSSLLVSDLSGAALTKTDDTNITLTLGGSPTVALLAATSLTLGWTGVLSIARGGTNATTGEFYSAVAGSGIVYFNGTRLTTTGDATFTWYNTDKTLLTATLADAAWPAIAFSHLSTVASSTHTIGISGTFGASGGGIQGTAFQIVTGKEQVWGLADSTHDSRLTFWTTLDNVSGEALDLRSSGSIICGKDSTGTTRTDDFTYICQTNGVPTGVPTAFGNRVAMTFDPNTDTFYIYRGGWKGVVVT